MLGLDWSELALIAVVAVVVIGPKDLPDAVRSIAKGIQKLRRMAGEFQGQVDEVVREAKLDDVRNSINEIRNFNVRGMVEKEIDRDGGLRKTFTENPIGNPLRDSFAPGQSTIPGAEVTPPPVVSPTEAAAPPPAFIPPGVTVPNWAATSMPAPVPAPANPPDFVPPTSQQVEREAALQPAVPTVSGDPAPAFPTPAFPTPAFPTPANPAAASAATADADTKAGSPAGTAS